jgi:hypothetical protein
VQRHPHRTYDMCIGVTTVVRGCRGRYKLQRRLWRHTVGKLVYIPLFNRAPKAEICRSFRYIRPQFRFGVILWVYGVPRKTENVESLINDILPAALMTCSMPQGTNAGVGSLFLISTGKFPPVSPVSPHEATINE